MSPCELILLFIRKSLPRFREYIPLHLQLERASFEPVFCGLRVPYQRCNMLNFCLRPPPRSPLSPSRPLCEREAGTALLPPVPFKPNAKGDVVSASSLPVFLTGLS